MVCFFRVFIVNDAFISIEHSTLTALVLVHIFQANHLYLCQNYYMQAISHIYDAVSLLMHIATGC